jgi:hypothetical protein
LGDRRVWLVVAHETETERARPIPGANPKQ